MNEARHHKQGHQRQQRERAPTRLRPRQAPSTGVLIAEQVVDALRIDTRHRRRRRLALGELEQGGGKRTAIAERADGGLIGGQLTKGYVAVAGSSQDRDEEEAVREGSGQDPTKRIAAAQVVSLKAQIAQNESQLKADEATRAIPVVAFTAGTAEDANRLIRAGCIGFIPKPFDAGTLPRLIAGFLRATVARDRRSPSR